MNDVLRAVYWILVYTWGPIIVVVVACLAVSAARRAWRHGREWRTAKRSMKRFDEELASLRRSVS